MRPGTTGGGRTAGIDFDAIAREQRDETKHVAGWQAPDAPDEWEEIDRDVAGGTRYRNRKRGWVAILSCGIERDGRAWLHLSLSHRIRVPRWSELVDAKRLFLGDREAYQVIPPKARYVNIDSRVLHLWTLLETGASALPDFTRGTGSI